MQKKQGSSTTSTILDFQDKEQSSSQDISLTRKYKNLIGKFVELKQQSKVFLTSTYDRRELKSNLECLTELWVRGTETIWDKMQIDSGTLEWIEK